MTSSNKERFYPSVGKSRRSSPGDSQSGFFSTGQGGRTVLPPLSDSFPTSRFPAPSPYSNPYTQPRSAPNKFGYDLDTQALYGAYPTTSPQFPTGFPNYEIHHNERYSPQPSYPTYPSRSSPPIMTNPADSRRLPPLSTSSPPPGDRWPQPAFGPTAGFPANNIRSPTATYPAPNQFMQYTTANQANAYQYHLAQDHVGLNAQSHGGMFEEMSRLEHRSTSPFRSSGSSHMSHVSPPQSYTPPPISPTSPEEPTVKKKRKRADANQLKVLNETYARTAFPSTEERISLAKMLDMSARSVQIWFQNKRQSMRQTNRQSANVSSNAHHPFVSSQVDPMADDLVPHPTSGYDGSGGLNEPLYLTSSSQDPSRSHTSHSHSHSHYGYHSSHRHRD